MINYRHYKTIYKNVPECFNELSQHQLFGICKLRLQELEDEVFLFHALRYMLRMLPVSYAMVPLDAKAAMMPYIKWVKDTNKLTAQLIPKYNGLWGPAKEFDNLTMGEWNACEIFYNVIRDADDEKESECALNNLIAVLYRNPKLFYNKCKDKDGDIRELFNSHTIGYRAQKKIVHWPAELKLAILMYYEGCRELLISSYDLFDKQSNEVAEDRDMFDLIDGLCGEKYGSFKAVEAMNVHQVMRILVRMKREAERIETETKRML